MNLPIDPPTDVTIDATYGTLLARLPPELHGPARGLLFELGLARTPGGGWADVFQLPPSRDLPRFTARSAHDSAPGLAAFLQVHHAACFHHVLVDRLADRQAPTTPERERLAEHFLAFWRDTLARALGGPGEEGGRGGESIDAALRAWRLGVGLEQAALARGSLGLARYGRSILLKLGWAGLASEALLRQRDEAHRLAHFRRAFHLLAVGMQCVDDAEDSAEDAAVHGTSVPAALGFPAAGLFTAGALLTRAAASAAAEGGFTLFFDWLVARAHELESIRARRISPADSLAGIVITSSLEAVCLSVAGPIPGATVAISSCASSR